MSDETNAKCRRCGKTEPRQQFDGYTLVPYGWIVLAEEGTGGGIRAELCSWRCAERFAIAQGDDR